MLDILSPTKSTEEEKFPGRYQEAGDFQSHHKSFLPSCWNVRDLNKAVQPRRRESQRTYLSNGLIWEKGVRGGRAGQDIQHQRVVRISHHPCRKRENEQHEQPRECAGTSWAAQTFSPLDVVRQLQNLHPYRNELLSQGIQSSFINFY